MFITPLFVWLHCGPARPGCQQMIYFVYPIDARRAWVHNEDSGKRGYIMKTNTELLMKALGWQGGTVHQVAHETGLTVSEILDLHTFRQFTHNTPRRQGRIDADEKCVKAVYLARREQYATKSTLISYWFGVVDYLRELEK
ncbi:hypothetical protein CB7_124 [Pectobacterium phage vB_PatM_CB7]|nr:hypothetical protein CB7_124 [Pectobacterium phage vB_PatM_CB7]